MGQTFYDKGVEPTCIFPFVVAFALGSIENKRTIGCLSQLKQKEKEHAIKHRSKFGSVLSVVQGTGAVRT